MNISRVRARKLQERFPKIEAQFDQDVAAFLLTVLDKKEKPWMFRKSEIFSKGGKTAWVGWQKLAALDLATHFRIDNYYVIEVALYTLDFREIALKAFGYSFKPTNDGGYWLYRYCHRVGYYRYKRNARRAAFHIIKNAIKGAR